MTVTVSGRRLHGTVVAPASKSVLHRLLICAALSDAPTVLTNTTMSGDIEATVACLRALGAGVVIGDDTIAVEPIGSVSTMPFLDCGESGSTIRFLLPVAAALGGASFTGRGRLAGRPLSPLYELLCDNGCELSPQGTFPLTVTGRLHGERFVIDGGVSSQFISGLLMAAPLIGGCEIVVTGAVESRPYIDLTIAAMRQFGIAVAVDGATFHIEAGSRYRSPARVEVEGDWSNAAFWLAAKALSGSALDVTGLDPASLQGDRAITRYLHGQPFEADVAQTPDLVPILAVLAAGANGRSVIGNARRLRLKESDRLQSVGAMITALGGDVQVTEESLIIDGHGRLRGGVVDAYNDHRIVMAAAVATCICDGAVEIRGAEAVNKSYPLFFKEWEERGMNVCPRYSETN